jgi:hypothetical protein
MNKNLLNTFSKRYDSLIFEALVRDQPVSKNKDTKDYGFEDSLQIDPALLQQQSKFTQSPIFQDASEVPIQGTLNLNNLVSLNKLQKPSSVTTTFEPYKDISSTPDITQSLKSRFISSFENPIDLKPNQNAILEPTETPEVTVQSTEPFKLPDNTSPTLLDKIKNRSSSLSKITDKLLPGNFTPEIKPTVLPSGDITPLNTGKDLRPNKSFFKGKLIPSLGHLGAFALTDLMLQEPGQELAKSVGIKDPRYVHAVGSIPSFYGSQFLTPYAMELGSKLGGGARLGAALSAAGEAGIEGLAAGPIISGLLAAAPLLQVAAEDLPDALTAAYHYNNLPADKREQWLSDYSDAVETRQRHEDIENAKKQKEKDAQELISKLKRQKNYGMSVDYVTGDPSALGR